MNEAKRILEDKEKGTFDVEFKDLGLQKDEIEKKMAEEAKTTPEVEATPTPISEQSPAPPPPKLPKREVQLLGLMLKHGYTSKAALASDLGVDVKTVQRHLGRLSDLGMVTREKKGYTLMQEGRKVAEKAVPDGQTKLG